MAYEAEVSLEKAEDRIGAGQAAGDNYVDALEEIRDKLDTNDGTTLGTMVSSQLSMTEAETKYMIETGIPKKVSGSVNQASQDIKKAGG